MKARDDESISKRANEQLDNREVSGEDNGMATE